MKLDTSHMRYLTSEDFKVLQAVEAGSRNHDLVPTKLIYQLSSMKNQSAVMKSIGDLAKLKLISRLRNAKYDGYRLTYNGYDYLAIKNLVNRNTLNQVGTTIGVGKESDIYAVFDKSKNKKVMKIHRLGRTSFRTVKNNRDYLKKNQSASWMFLSRLASEKEYQFMCTLFNNGFSVPHPYDCSRHCVVMELINGFPMRQLKEHQNYQKLYSDLMKFIVQLANKGLIHCDYNEFNIIIREQEDVGKFDEDFVVIDFPQCISIDHVDAELYFQRDVECIRRFFRKKFNYTPKNDSTMLDTEGYGEGYAYLYPVFKRDVKRNGSLDVEVLASGYIKVTKNGVRPTEEEQELELAFDEMRINEDSDIESDSDFDSEEYISSEGEEEDDLDEENEKIIEALSEGKELKVDKFGNYILEE